MTDEYRDAIANLATAVSIITTTADGKPAGMTASAVCSLSLEPVLLLVCINARLPTHEAIERAGRFAVNVLPEGCERLATHFARPAPDKFADVRLVAGHECPAAIIQSSSAGYGDASGEPTGNRSSTSTGNSAVLIIPKKNL